MALGMKPIAIHPVSAGGATLLAVAFALLTLSAWQTPAPAQPIVSARAIAGIYDPHSAVVIREGTPYVVPAGKLLVFTGLGTTLGGIVGLYIDGGLETSASYGSAGNPSVVAIPPGLTAGAASVVTVGFSSSSTGRAWGFLIDA